MDILLHTIALEPARWTPQRVSRPLAQLLPAIAERGFKQLEIYEPHLRDEAEWPEIIATLTSLGLKAEILSSYLDLKTSENFDDLKRRLDAFGFTKARIFPSAPATEEGMNTLAVRLRRLSARIPGVEILLETHDGSLADDPPLLVRMMEELSHPRIGLLYQPTFFDAERSLRQFELEKPFIRHLHLQGRRADTSFTRLEDGLVPWSRIITELSPEVNATLEFVPCAVCPPEQFDLAAALSEARSETDYARLLAM